MAGCTISSQDSTAADMRCVKAREVVLKPNGETEVICDEYIPKAPLPTVTVTVTP